MVLIVLRDSLFVIREGVPLLRHEYLWGYLRVDYILKRKLKV